jgi:hypothetical protein
MRQAPVYAERRVHSADGLTGFCRLYGERLALDDFFWRMPE